MNVMRTLLLALAISDSHGFNGMRLQRSPFTGISQRLARLDLPRLMNRLWKTAAEAPINRVSFNGHWTVEQDVSSQALAPILGKAFASHVHIMQQKSGMQLKTSNEEGKPIMFKFRLDGTPTIFDTGMGTKVTRSAFQDDMGMVIQEHNPYGIPISLEERTLLDNGKRMRLSGYRWVDKKKTAIEPVYYVRTGGFGDLS